MALDFNNLPTRAACDTVVAKLEAELDTYQVRDLVNEYGDRQDGRSQTDLASQLVEVNANIASYNAVLALGSISAKTRDANEELLRKALFRKGTLERRNAQVAGPERFLADVDAEQIQAQIDVLTAAKTAVIAHRATLAA